MYNPKPISTDHLPFPDELEALMDRLAEHNHDIWARQRIQDGWKWGPERNDRLKQHPGLVPYGQLADAEKTYDRNSVRESLKAIMVLGYEIVPKT